MKPTEPQKFAIVRAHRYAIETGLTFVLAFNPSKSPSIFCVRLTRLQKERPSGLTEEDVFYTAEPDTPIPEYKS